MVKKKDFFWASYSDVMTSLFFIMLVLFVLVVIMMKRKNENLVEDIEKLKKITRLEQQFAPLNHDKSFTYLTACKKYVSSDLRGHEIFNPKSVVIKPQYVPSTLAFGRKLESFLNKLNKQNSDFRYVVVIEGNMANKYDNSWDKNNEWGYKTSYERALAVYNLWLKHGIDLRSYNAEILICGSGFNGICRDPVEEYNKRFSIQIIPLVSNFTPNE